MGLDLCKLLARGHLGGKIQSEEEDRPGWQDRQVHFQEQVISWQS